MAQKRMFSLKIVDSDNFLAMPISSRLLYYDLAMRADDDGFVDSPKKILRAIGCTEDDFKILCSKQYIFPFETGICVIKDWKVHNYIQKDRYQETHYKSEKSQLFLDENGSYTKQKLLVSNLDTKCVQTVSKMDTQSRIDKVSIDKNRRDKSSREEPTTTVSKNNKKNLTERKSLNELQYNKIQEICLDHPRFKNSLQVRKTFKELSRKEKENLKKLIEIIGKKNIENYTNWMIKNNLYKNFSIGQMTVTWVMEKFINNEETFPDKSKNTEHKKMRLNRKLMTDAEWLENRKHVFEISFETHFESEVEGCSKRMDDISKMLKIKKVIDPYNEIDLKIYTRLEEDGFFEWEGKKLVITKDKENYKKTAYKNMIERVKKGDNDVF